MPWHASPSGGVPAPRWAASSWGSVAMISVAPDPASSSVPSRRTNTRAVAPSGSCGSGGAASARARRGPHATTATRDPLTAMAGSPASTVDPGKQLEAGLGTGVGKALDRLAQYYISLAEKVFPVIEVDAGRSVDVVLTQGVALPGTLDAAGTDPDNLAQLAERARTLRRNDDEDD